MKPVRAAFVVIVAMASATLSAERLPLTTYSIAQGLAGNDVAAALEDDLGFLWLGTERGLSRFDGKGFRTFGTAQGLPDARVVDLARTSDGTLWVAVWGAVYRFETAHGRFFEVPVEGRVRRWERIFLTIDSRGQLWCGADGLYKLTTGGHGAIVLRRETPPDQAPPYVMALAADRAGNLWIASERLYRRLADGQIAAVATDIAPGGFWGIAVDRDGSVWAATATALLRGQSCGSSADSRCVMRRVASLRLNSGTRLLVLDDGLWLSTVDGLVEVDRQARPRRVISRAQGLMAGTPTPLLVDRSGDLWIGVRASGVQRLAARGFTSYGADDGLETTVANAFITTTRGEFVVAGQGHVLHRFDGRRFVAVSPRLPAAARDPGWGWYQADAQDHQGAWWLATANGVARLRATSRIDDLAAASPLELLGERGCFRGRDVFRVYEDSRHDVWVGTIEMNRPTVHRWRRAENRFDCYTSAAFLSEEAAPTAFLDDGAGSLWIGFYLGQVVRFRDGQFTCVLNCSDPAQGIVTSMWLDRRRRLWISTGRAGVLRIDDISADRPQAVRLTTRDGLTSNRTGAIVEDTIGNIYIGSDLGVDVIEPGGTPVLHYGTDRGLPHPFVGVAAVDPGGDVWVGTLDGVARLRPSAVDPRPEARVLIDGVTVAGLAQAVPASGLPGAGPLTLAADQRNLEVSFLVLPREIAGSVRFQYRLSDREPWSAASANRSIVLAGLAPGDHRLQIRAITAQGVASSTPAVVGLRVLAPFYRRPWVVAAAVALLALAGFGAYRARIAHVTAMARQRTRIAMDLHDDMGSRLGSIGLLADLAADDRLTTAARAHLLDQIAESTSEMGSSLDEIVWSLRPGSTSLNGVIERLIVHGRRLFASGTPELDVRVAEARPDVTLGLDVARNVLLIGLEALHNAARHAAAHRVTLDLRPDGRCWLLTITDDGKGLVTGGGAADDLRGLGLQSMRHRAAAIGADVSVDGVTGQGTAVRLRFSPHPRRAARSRMNIRRIWTRPWDMT